MVITRGDTKFLTIKYLNSEKEPIIIPESGNLKFTVRDQIDGTQLFQKVLTAADYDDSQEGYSLTIDADDTANVSMKNISSVDYYYDIQLSYMEDDKEIVRTIDKGIFTIEYDITKP